MECESCCIILGAASPPYRVLFVSFENSVELSATTITAVSLLNIDVVPDSMTLSVVRLSPLGSQLSFSHSLARIESITDWEAIARKYRALMGETDDHGVRSDTSDGMAAPHSASAAHASTGPNNNNNMTAGSPS